MPRPDLSAHMNPAPLTIATVAQRLGVSASTIRTWERRYGLGPKREPGKRRRYNEIELKRLERMVRLVRSGVFPSDAAQAIKSSDEVLTDSESAITVESILDTARRGDFNSLQRNLDVLISRDGLLHTWHEYIGPAMRGTYYPPKGDKLGIAPRSLITQATLYAVYQVAKQAPEHSAGFPDACPVLIVCDAAHELRAHIVGVALEWEGVPARIVPVTAPAEGPDICPQDVSEAIKEYRDSFGAHVLILIGLLSSDEKVIEGVDDGGSNLILVGRHCPLESAPGATRLRTLTACVEEAVDSARNCSIPESVGVN